MVFDAVATAAVEYLGLTGRAADAVHFWVYDTLKITAILLLVIFGVGYLRTYLPPEKIRDYVRNRHSVTGY
ncbi:MAG: permease, partial [Halobacteriaceae archaeon]